MAVKQILLISVFFLLSACISVTRDKSTRRDSALFTKQYFSQNRILKLGQPTFIQNKKNNFSIQKHIKKQWALKDISILEALKILEKKQKKEPIVVAVVDTGIHTKHQCLKNNLWLNKGEIPNNGKDDDGNGFRDDIHGWNFVSNNNDIQDYHGHGTHISGIIAAQGETPNSPHCKVIGVAPHVRIMTLKYFAEGADNNNIKNTVNSIKYAVDNGADIINYSGGGPGENTDEKSIIAKAADKNIIFVAALGNEGSQVGQKHSIKNKFRRLRSNNKNSKKKITYYPASYEFPNIIPLQAQNKQNEIIKSSNRIQIESHEDKDRKVQTAPGENIISTLPPRKYLLSYKEENGSRYVASTTDQNNNYGLMTGTSQATAFATGVVALVKTLYPTWSMEKLINQVIKTGFDQGTDKIKKTTNQGKKLNAYKALIMRDQNVDQSDQTDNTNTAFPAIDPAKVDSIFKNPVKPREALDVYDPEKEKEKTENQLQQLQNITNTFKKQKSK